MSGNVVPIRKRQGARVADGLLMLQCPKCEELIEVGLHITHVPDDRTSRVSELTGTHYGHLVEFYAQAPHLHAAFWGHLVRCHQPDPHPYMSGPTGEGA